MASNDYRVNMIWASHGEQLRADLQRTIGQLTGFRGEVNKSSRQMGLWGQQIKAVGTTLRYAFAGAVVYGVATAVNSLSDFEAKLGDIDSLAAKLDSSGRLVGLGRNLDQVGDFALKTSNRVGIAAGQVEDSMTTFYSSFQPPPGNKGLSQMREFVGVASELQRVAEGADPKKISEGLAGLVYAFGGGNPKTSRKFGSLLAQFQGISVGFTGEAISRDIGRLTASATAGRMTPEQILGVVTTASQTGGSSAVISRGIAQLFSNILTPSSKRVKAAYGQAGLPTDPNLLSRFQFGGATGGLAVLLKMIQAVGPVKVKNRRILTSEDFTDEEAVSAAGVSGGNIGMARNLFTRAESFRQFLNIMTRGPDTIDKFIKSLQEGERNNVLGQRFKLAAAQSELQRAANANRNLSTQILRGFDPVLHVLSRGISGISNMGISNPGVTTAAITGSAGAALASRIFLGVGLGGLLGRGFRRIPGVGGAIERLGARNPLFGRMVGRGGDLAAAGLVGSGLGAFSSTGKGTRGDPIWTVIDPLSWFMPGAPSGRGMGGGGGTDVVPVTGPGRLKRLLGRFGRGAARVGGAAALGEGAIAVGTAGAVALGDVLVPLMTPGASHQTGGLPGALGHINAHAYPTLNRILQRVVRTGKTSGLGLPEATIQQALSTMGQPGTHGWHPGKANALLERAMRDQRSNQHGFGASILGMVEGMAIVDIALDLSPEGKRLLKDTDKRHRVPVKLWSAASGGGRPKTRGKAKTTRGQSGR